MGVVLDSVFDNMEMFSKIYVQSITFFGIIMGMAGIMHANLANEIVNIDAS